MVDPSEPIHVTPAARRASSRVAARSSPPRSSGSRSIRAGAGPSTPVPRRVASPTACSRPAPPRSSRSTWAAASWRGRSATTRASRVLERTNVRGLEPDDIGGRGRRRAPPTSPSSRSSRWPRPCAAAAPPAADLVLLVKPQFEAGRARVGEGGVVRDPDVHRAVLARGARRARRATASSPSARWCRRSGAPTATSSSSSTCRGAAVCSSTTACSTPRSTTRSRIPGRAGDRAPRRARPAPVPGRRGRAGQARRRPSRRARRRGAGPRSRRRQRRARAPRGRPRALRRRARRRDLARRRRHDAPRRRPRLRSRRGRARRERRPARLPHRDRARRLRRRARPPARRRLRGRRAHGARDRRRVGGLGAAAAGSGSTKRCSRRCTPGGWSASRST